MRFQSFFMSTTAHFIQRCGIQGFVEASEWCVAVVGAYGVSVMDNQTPSELPNAAIGGQRMNSLMKLGPGTPPNGCDREIAILQGRAHAGPLTDVRYWPIVLQKSPTSCQSANNGQDLNPKERILESIFRIAARSRKNILRSTAQNRFATQSAISRNDLAFRRYAHARSLGNCEVSSPVGGASAALNQNFSGTKFRPRNDAWSSYLYLVDRFGSLTLGRDTFLYETSSRIFEMQLRRPRRLSSDLTICQGAYLTSVAFNMASRALE
jgi:hypothetical protein